MNENEQRQYPRYETEILVTIYTKDEKITGTIIDIGKGGFGLISEKEIRPGTDVRIQIKHGEEFTIRGTGPSGTPMQNCVSFVFGPRCVLAY